MNKISSHIALYFVISVFIPTLLLGSDKVEIQWMSFDSGLAAAKKLDKKIIVSVYTTWCGWCKRMDRDVFTDQRVAVYLNENYVTVKLNAESDATATYKGKTGSEKTLARSFRVTGYPTTLFFEPDGELITSVSGYFSADKLLPILKFLGENHFKIMSWEEYFENHEKSDKK
ncbi:MAG TPA: DUF255 domain-containing protein [Bacteroidota bacterium]|nr:DUF255 domain-containing protein [Bacteroidota bacterium]